MISWVVEITYLRQVSKTLITFKSTVGLKLYAFSDMASIFQSAPICYLYNRSHYDDTRAVIGNGKIILR